MKVLTRGWKADLVDLAKSAKSDVLVVCPFIGTAAFDVFGPARKDGVTRRLITKLDKVDLWKTVSDSKVLMDLGASGVQVKSLQDLHAKLYIVDRERAVVTSANLTGGGLERNYEAGVLLEKPASAGVIAYAEDLWNRLTLVTQTQLVDLHNAVEAFRRNHPGKVEVLPEELTDESEKLPQSTRTREIKVRNRTRLDARKLELQLSDFNMSLGKDMESKYFKQFRQELLDSDWEGISVKSYLWLLGWCNTKGNPKESARLSAMSLARTLFGYTPGPILIDDGKSYSLKKLRYTDHIPFRSQIIRMHEEEVRNSRLV